MLRYANRSITIFIRNKLVKYGKNWHRKITVSFMLNFKYLWTDEHKKSINKFMNIYLN